MQRTQFKIFRALQEVFIVIRKISKQFKVNKIIYLIIKMKLC